MEKEIRDLTKAIRELISAIPQPQSGTPQSVPAPEVPKAPEAPAPEAPKAPAAPAVPEAPVAPEAPAAPVVPEAPAAMTHDEVRAKLLPIIQSNQGAMTAVHDVLTKQFAVNELTSLPVAQIPMFMTAVDQALEALPK